VIARAARLSARPNRSIGPKGTSLWRFPQAKRTTVLTGARRKARADLTPQLAVSPSDYEQGNT
jgi:hypothetical protein